MENLPKIERKDRYSNDGYGVIWEEGIVPSLQEIIEVAKTEFPGIPLENLEVSNTNGDETWLRVKK